MIGTLRRRVRVEGERGSGETIGALMAWAFNFALIGIILTIMMAFIARTSVKDFAAEGAQFTAEAGGDVVRDYISYGGATTPRSPSQYVAYMVDTYSPFVSSVDSVTCGIPVGSGADGALAVCNVSWKANWLALAAILTGEAPWRKSNETFATAVTETGTNPND